jgi:hypothetical protein
LLHDKQCTNGSHASQPELHLQQTLPLLCPEPYKHPKTTKLNHNTTKEEGDGNLNITIEENNDALPHCPLLFLLLKHRKEGDNNLLPSPSLFQQHHRKR